MFNLLLTTLPVAALWSIPPIVFKTYLKRISYQTLFAVNGIISLVCTLVLMFANRDTIQKEIVTLTWSNIMLLSLMTATCSIFAGILYMQALQHHDSHVVTALVAIAPVFTMILAILFLNEKVTLNGVIGTLLVVSGIILLSFNTP